MKRTLLLLAVFAVVHFAMAQPGTIDKSFGNDGKVITSIGIQDRATGMAIQKDGKNIVVGYAGVITQLGQYKVQASNFAVARYNTDGSLDKTFGDGGKTLTKFYYNSDDVAVDVVLQPDGKIVVGGYGARFTGSVDTAAAEIVRYNPNGSIDSSFGNGGKVRYKSNSQIFISSIALQSDGKIVLGGTKDERFAVLRFTKNGKPDQSFGTNGLAAIDFGSYCSVFSIAIDANDRIIMTGASQTGQFLTARVDKNGSLDKLFGNNGFVTTTFKRGKLPVSAYATSVVIQPDGKIVVGGNGSTGIDVGLIFIDFSYATARYNPNGSIDKTFGDGGTQLIRLGTPGETALTYKTLLKPDGKIIQIGESGIHIGIAQLLPNGQPDKSYGKGGVSDFVSFDNKYLSPALTGILQQDGKLITGGYVTGKPYDDSSQLDWSITRFNGDNTSITRTQSDITVAGGLENTSLSQLSLYPNPVSGTVTTLKYTLAKAERVTITLTNAQGNMLKVFAHELNQPAGRYSQQLILPSGMINGTYTITINTSTEKKMLTIIK